MSSREALPGRLNYRINKIEAGYFNISVVVTYVADAAAGGDIAVLDAKQIAAARLTCSIGDDSYKFSAF